MARTFAINFAIPAMFEPGNVSVRNVRDFQWGTNLPEAGPRGGPFWFRALTRNAGWFAVLAFGMLVTLISKGNSVRFAFVRGRPSPKLRPQL
jgi:hypothetical protein